MKKFLGIFFSLFVFYHVNACDDASFGITNETDNGNGTYTFSYNFCAEFNGLEGSPDWWNLVFSGGTFTTVSGFTPSSVSTTSGDIYNGTLLSGNTEIRWNTSSTFIAHSGSTLCYTGTITTNGRPTTINISYHDTYGGSCDVVYNISSPPASCTIDNVTIGTQSTCNTSNNTYTQDVQISFTNPPASGTLDVNGQSFPIGTSPQTVTLTGLAADGNIVNFTAAFSGIRGVPAQAPSRLLPLVAHLPPVVSML